MSAKHSWFKAERQRAEARFCIKAFATLTSISVHQTAPFKQHQIIMKVLEQLIKCNCDPISVFKNCSDNFG